MLDSEMIRQDAIERNDKKKEQIIEKQRIRNEYLELRKKEYEFKQKLRSERIQQRVQSAELKRAN